MIAPPPNVALSTPIVAVSPAVARRGERALLTVRGLIVPTLEARLVGAATPAGVPFGWTTLHPGLGGWFVQLERPALPGVYPIELRTRPGGRVFRSKRWLFRVLDRGTLSLPSFSTPEGVARWWVRAVGQQIVALKRWPRPAFDRRERRLHQLLVVAYHAPGDNRIAHRLGVFITAFRSTVNGRWRLLEVTVTP